MKKTADADRVFSYTGDPLDPCGFNELVKRKIGCMCYVSKMAENIDDYVEIGILREEVVRDDYAGTFDIYLRGYDNVFKAYYEDGKFGRNVVFPSSKEVHDMFSNKMNRRTFGSEDCIMQTMGSKLLRITTVRNQINPLIEILNAVATFGSVPLTKLISKPSESKRIRQYVEFLEDLNLVRVEDLNREACVVLENAIHRETGDWTKESAIDVLSRSIGRKEILTLQNDFSLKNIMPYIRMSNINCLSSYFEDKALRWTPERFNSGLSSFYPDVISNDGVKALNQAYSLEEVEIFDSSKSERGIVFSCSPVLDEYSSYVKKHGDFLFA